jgi:hypothetical protein
VLGAPRPRRLLALPHLNDVKMSEKAG